MADPHDLVPTLAVTSMLIHKWWYGPLYNAAKTNQLAVTEEVDTHKCCGNSYVLYCRILYGPCMCMYLTAPTYDLLFGGGRCTLL